MYFSDSKESDLSVINCAKKHVRFNSSNVSSPSDVQTPRPFPERQTMTNKTVFSEDFINDSASSKRLEIVKMYLPSKSFFKNNVINMSNEIAPKPCSDLELSVFEASSFADVKPTSSSEKTISENDMPYPFSPSSMPLSNPINARQSFIGFPAELVKNAAASKKMFHCGEQSSDESTLDFFTRSAKNKNLDITNYKNRQWQDDISNAKITVMAKAPIPSRSNKHVQDTVENMSSKHHVAHKTDAGNNPVILCESHYGCLVNKMGTSKENPCVDNCCHMARSHHNCHPNLNCSSNKLPKNLCCNNVQSNEVNIDPINAVEEKRRAIEEKHKWQTVDQNRRQVVSLKNADEPSVSDLYEIIQKQNKQLQKLQQQFEQFLIKSEKNERCNFGSNNQKMQSENFEQQTNKNLQHMDSVSHVEHISIGVMTSFEMVMSTNIVTKCNSRDDFIDEGVQTSIQNVKNQSDAISHNTQISQHVLKQKNDEISNAHNPIPNSKLNAGQNILDGINRVNNFPVSKNCENKVLDKIIEEYPDNVLEVNKIDATTAHQTPMPTEIICADKTKNNGWTFYDNVLNRVNNILNSPPNTNLKHANKQQISPVIMAPPNPVMTTERLNSPTRRHHSNAVQHGILPKHSTQPYFGYVERPASDLSLHMKQLASKYNISAPTKNQYVDIPALDAQFVRPVYPNERHGNLLVNRIDSIPINPFQLHPYIEHNNNIRSNDLNIGNEIGFQNGNQRFEQEIVKEKYLDKDKRNLVDNFNNGYKFDNTHHPIMGCGGAYHTCDNGFQCNAISNNRHPTALKTVESQKHIGDGRENIYHNVPTDLSFATLQYMQRYQSMTVTECPQPIGTAATPPSKTKPLPPPYRNASRILDITTLKQQPKLL